MICNHPKALSKKNKYDKAKNELIDPKNQLNNNVGKWWHNYCTSDELNNIENSNKMKLVFSILEECELSNEKLLLFSHSLATLDTIEYFLEEKLKLRDRYYFRLDGDTLEGKRIDDIKKFLEIDTYRYLKSGFYINCLL